MKKSWIVLVFLFAGPTLGAAEPAQISRNDTLRSKPFSDAPLLAPLKSGQSVEILRRDGAWYQLKAANQSGWTPMLSVRRTAAAASVSSKSLAQTASGRSATGKIVATTGVRGLGEEELKIAAFSASAVAAAEAVRVTPMEGEKFAREGGLQPRPVPELNPQRGGTN